MSLAQRKASGILWGREWVEREPPLSHPQPILGVAAGGGRRVQAGGVPGGVVFCDAAATICSRCFIRRPTLNFTVRLGGT